MQGTNWCAEGQGKEKCPSVCSLTHSFLHIVVLLLRSFLHITTFAPTSYSTRPSKRMKISTSKAATTSKAAKGKSPLEADTTKPGKRKAPEQALKIRIGKGSPPKQKKDAKSRYSECTL